ncbi:MAG: hypothetical protein DSZ05_02070 [Sulfurospirillum sp.]|nr:MAG: hypothetical protein DSZ05_02070 [Sulfurospirillum sp.]
MEKIKEIVIVLLLLFSAAQGGEQMSGEEIYQQNCMKCHKQMSLTMQKIFMRYLLKYSSEVSVKSALFDFLREPNYFTSALRKDQIMRYGLKGKSTLTDRQLRKAIDTYWERYKIFGKLK